MPVFFQDFSRNKQTLFTIINDTQLRHKAPAGKIRNKLSTIAIRILKLSLSGTNTPQLWLSSSVVQQDSFNFGILIGISVKADIIVSKPTNIRIDHRQIVTLVWF